MSLAYFLILTSVLGMTFKFLGNSSKRGMGVSNFVLTGISFLRVLGRMVFVSIINSPLGADILTTLRADRKDRIERGDKVDSSKGSTTDQAILSNDPRA